MCAPSAAKRSAVARPIRLVPPVTMAVLPSSCPIAAPYVGDVRETHGLESRERFLSSAKKLALARDACQPEGMPGICRLRATDGVIEGDVAAPAGRPGVPDAARACYSCAGCDRRPDPPHTGGGATVRRRAAAARRSWPCP